VVSETGRKSWDEASQTALIAQILSGAMSLRTACERHGLSAETLRDWVPVYRQKTLQALDERLQQTFAVRGAGAMRAGGAAYTGTLDDLPLADLLQTIQMGRKDAVISVTRATERSSIWCDKGEVMDAECGRLRGEAAVYRILNFDQGQVFADFRFEVRPRTIDLPGHLLLMEAARHKDECVRWLERLDGAQTIYRPAAGAMAVRATPAERAVLDLCDGERPVRDVLEASDMADLETLSAMASLADRGYLLRDGASPAPPPSARTPMVGSHTPHSLVYSPLDPSPREASSPSSAFSLVSLGLVLGTLLWMGIEALRNETSWLERALAARSASFVLEANTEPPGAELWLDGVRVGGGLVRREFPRDGTLHRLDVAAEGYIPTSVLFVDAAPLSRIVLEKLPNAPPSRP
jgi:transposase-like protein